jgi:phosphatidylinositol alpha-1,6-mannosyltransferase
MITPAFPPDVGGIQLLCERLAQHLEGFELTVIAPAAPENVSAVDRSASDGSASAGLSRVGSAGGVSVRRPPRVSGVLHGLARMVALNAYAATTALSSRPAVVLNMHIATAPAAWAAPAPYVQYVYASELAPREGLARRALERAARVVAISGHSHDLAVRHGADPQSVTTIVPGVDQPPAFGVPDRSAPRVLLVSRMDEGYKGHDTLIRALPLIRSAVPGVRLRLAGDGRLRSYYEHLADCIGALPAIDFLGRVSQAERSEELLKASVFCLPARLAPDGSGEGFGIALLEAGAWGLPVVAGACGGVPDAVVDGTTGLLLRDSLDHVELADTLTRVLQDDALRRALGEAGRGHSAAFSWQRMADEVAALCREVIAKSV